MKTLRITRNPPEGPRSTDEFFVHDVFDISTFVSGKKMVMFVDYFGIETVVSTNWVVDIRLFPKTLHPCPCCGIDLAGKSAVTLVAAGGTGSTYLCVPCADYRRDNPGEIWESGEFVPTEGCMEATHLT